MNGEQLMERILDCEQSRQRIPMELQASLPLPGRRGNGTAECWYYRMQCSPDGVRIDSPACYVLWDVENMSILKMERMPSVYLGSGEDILTGEQRVREDAYLSRMDAACGPYSDELRQQWLEAAPKAMKAWLEEELNKA